MVPAVARATPTPTIEALAVRAQRGERGCYDEIVRRLEPRLRQFLLQRVGEAADADDLVQETFVRALDNLSRYDPAYRFSTWLFAIAGNLAVSHHRRRRDGTGEVDALSDGRDAAADAARRDEGARLWRRAHEVLHPSQYAALYMRYADDLSIGEIAKRTGRSAVHVRVSLYRARRRLAREVE